MPEIFGQQVQKLKDRGEILPELTVGAVWQEVISNNFSKFAERPYVVIRRTHRKRAYSEEYAMFVKRYGLEWRAEGNH